MNTYNFYYLKTNHNMYMINPTSVTIYSPIIIAVFDLHNPRPILREFWKNMGLPVSLGYM